MKVNLFFAYELAKMFGTKRNIRRLLMNFTEKFYRMVHVESLDIRTIKMVGIIPKGEPNKVVLTVESADFTDSTIKEIVPNKDSVSYHLLRQIQSLYSAFLSENANIYSFVEQCVGFCDALYAIAMVLWEYTNHGMNDIFMGAIDCGDNAAKDLVFYVTYR